MLQTGKRKPRFLPLLGLTLGGGRRGWAGLRLQRAALACALAEQPLSPSS